MKKNQKRKGYEITLAVSDNGDWPEISAKNLMRHVTVDLPSGLTLSKFKVKQPKLKVETVCADWKDLEGFVDGLLEALPRLGISVIRHPDFEGSDMVGLLISNRPLTKAELVDERVEPDLHE